MCQACGERIVDRRRLLTLSASGAVALALAASTRGVAAESAPTTLSSDEALAALKSGNERYVSNPKLCSAELASSRSAVAGHQAPWATVIACADSRVPPELIFGGLGVGELDRKSTRLNSSHHSIS